MASAVEDLLLLYQRFKKVWYLGLKDDSVDPPKSLREYPETMQRGDSCVMGNW